MNISLHNYSIEIVSVSTNTELERLYDYMYGTMICKISYILLLLLTHILGPCLLLGIIAYEKRGGDPQKGILSIGFIQLVYQVISYSLSQSG